MTQRERLQFMILISGRCLASLFDLLGVMALGFLATSTAMFIANGSDPSRKLKVLSFTFPALTVKELPIAVGLVLGLFIGKAIVSICLTRVTVRMVANIESRAATQIVHLQLGKGLEEFRRYTSQELQFATSYGVSAAFGNSLTSLATLISEGALFAGLLGVFVLVDPISSFYTIAFFGAIAFFIQRIIGSKMAETGEKIRRGTIDSNSNLESLSTAFREISVLQRRDHFLNLYRDARSIAAKNIGEQIYLGSLPRYIVETCVLLGVFSFGAIKLATSDLATAVATLSVFLTGSMRLMAAMLPSQSALVALKQSAAQAKSAVEILSSASTSAVAWEHSTVKPRPSKGACVELKGVTYRYPQTDRDAVSDINLQIDSGSVVAFVGESGSGKSTLADLILGLEEPTSGQIEICGSKPASLKSGTLSYVPQTVGLVPGTIRENITFGSPLLDDESVISEAVEAAGLLEMVQSLPAGLDTDLGSQKDGLSGGQLQRIGLARALCVKPALLVLDEATSALDAPTEDAINTALKSLKGKTTLIVIAHRLNSIRHADHVVMFEKGRIVAQGNFDTLYAHNPSFASAVRLMSSFSPIEDAL